MRMERFLLVAIVCLATVAAVVESSTVPTGEVFALEEAETAEPASAAQQVVDAQRAEQRKADAAAAETAKASAALSHELNRMKSSKELHDKLTAMNADKRPLDIMAERYPKLGVKPSSTPQSVLRAEAHERRVNTMERKMKKKDAKKSRVFEKYTRMKIPTLAGMRMAIKTTVDSNMQQALGSLPSTGLPTWSDVLPGAVALTPNAKGKGDAAKPLRSSKGAMAKAQSAMLETRQKEIDKQEKRLGAAKAKEAAQMSKVANAANAFESKVLNKERKIQVNAQKKVHDASFAMDRALAQARLSNNRRYQEMLKVRRLKQALTRAVIAQKSMKKAAQAEANHWKRMGRKRESIAVRRLKKMFKKRLAAMARGAQKLALRAIKAQKRAGADAAKIRYMKSKLMLQARQDKRLRHTEMHRLRKQETRLWKRRIKDVRRQSMRQQKLAQTRLHAEQAQGAQIAKRALKNQQLLRKMQLPAQMSAVVNRLQKKNTQRVKALTKQNAQMKNRIATLLSKLNGFHKQQVRQEVALHGTRRANKKLVHVIDALKNGDLPTSHGKK